MNNGQRKADMLVEDRSAWGRFVARLERHWRWGRTQGFGRLVEEDQLDPFDRLASRYRRYRWRRANPVVAGTAMPVYLVGVQRSGTNMIVRGLETAPEFEVRNENDSEIFERFKLRSDDVVAGVLGRSRHAYVLMKPLCDSHRVDELLQGIRTSTPGRAIWAYRDVDGRVRSAITKFGDVNRTVLGEIAQGKGMHRWQAQGLSEDVLGFIRSFDFSSMSPASGAALFWYARNSLYFDRGFDRRDDVMLASYSRFVAEPERSMKALCGFLGFPYRGSLVEHIDARAGGPKPPLEIDPRIRERSAELYARLDSAAARQAAAVPGA